MALDAFEKNVHVLCEKPLAVSVTAAREVAEAYRKYPHLKFGVMFNQRTNPLYQKMREMVASGEIGEISRVTWICTAWFRSWTYYASGGWRATWKGEGGGVLINQCPHSLDLLQWITGIMPNRVTGVTFLGKTHPIEVEDEVSAILEYPNGAIGHFIASTGEAPGSNRLEINGSLGKLVAEENKLKFYRNRVDAQEYNRTTTNVFGAPENWYIELPVKSSSGSEHQAMTQIFVNGVINDIPNEKLLAPGPDGINGLELGNAMVMAGVTRNPVTLPLDGKAYDAFLDDMAKKYGGKKTLETRKSTLDFAASQSTR
jgi:predicted dehydrogenase